MTKREIKEKKFFGSFALKSKSLSFLVFLKTGRERIESLPAGDCLPVLVDWSRAKDPKNQKQVRRMIKWLYKQGHLA